jgi:hypothetical protein
LAATKKLFNQQTKVEIALFLGLMFIGFVVMPVAIYLVGQQFFGAYGGHGYGDFFATLSGKIRSGDIVAWFLISSPYLAWQALRLTAFGWRVTNRGH